MGEGLFVVYMLMQDQGLYHMLNHYASEERAKLHLDNARDGSVLKMVKLFNIPDNIPVEEFEKMWSEQQPVADWWRQDLVNGGYTNQI